LTFRPLSDGFIRRSWYSVLPLLDTTGRRRTMGKISCKMHIQMLHEMGFGYKATLANFFIKMS